VCVCLCVCFCVWHDGLWQTMRKYKFDVNIIETIEALYGMTTSTVLVNNEIGPFFKTTVDVKQSCILSPVLLNIYPENNMQETSDNFE
jgi:hypothetical protein